ncbi:MAG: DinB family protein [Caldilineales bacterium]|nr:DinB family protein [Caldilineales bacterium]
MHAVESQRQAFKWATELLEMTIAGTSPEHLHWNPPGTANTLAALYAHAVCGIDGVLNLLLRNTASHFSTDWAGRTGVSEPRWNITPEWSRSVRIDLAAMRPYVEMVYAEADAHMAALTEDDLEREINLSSQGLGKRNVDWCLSALMTGHVNNMAGEISCLKGVQGLQGYPF